MLARCSHAVFALALCLCSSSALSQEGSGGGKLTLPEDLFGAGEAAVTPSDSGITSGVTGQELPAAAPYYNDAPSSYSGGGMSYSPSLGGHLRARYNTQSYGQAAGNLDLGTMFLRREGDRAWFLDGQVTLNDESHVGFNLGLGARALFDTPNPLLGDPQKILGVSLWADGSSTVNDNFFPQLGLSGELLGEKWDLRANASFVLEDQTAFGAPRVGPGGVQYTGYNLSTLSITGRDNAMHLTELELARRVGNRELWGFAGGYGLYGADGVDTAGYQLGFRGYATPDVALQLKVTDDDLFQTNTVFSITWFIGRTRTDTRLNCDLADRLREPVQRNDYVAVYNDSVTGAVEALTNDFDDDGTTEAIRVVHVDSTAIGGGDGTFENPYNSLDAVNAGSQDGDIILVHSGGIFAEQSVTLQDYQRLLGEGNDITFTVATDQFGPLTLPETSAGARSGVAPIINNTAATAVLLADNNEVANFAINGGASAIVAGANGAGSPNLHDLTIDGTTGDAIVLTPLERVDGANTTIAFSARLNNIDFSDVGGSDINIDAASTSDPSLPNVTLNEAISITNITSTGNGATSLLVANTHSGGTLTVDNYSWDGGTSGLVGMAFTDTAGLVNVTNSDLTGGAANAVGFDISGNTGIVTIGASNTITNINGDAANIFQADARVDFAAAVSNTTVAGGTVTVQENTAAVNVNGDITTFDATSVSIIDAMEDVTVSSDITRNGAAGVAVAITDTNAADDDPNDGVSILFSDPNAVIDSNGGSMAVVVNGGDDNVTFLAAVEDTGGVLVQNRTGGRVDFGGGLTSVTGDNDAVTITSNSEDSVVQFMDLDITTTSGRGLFADSGELNVTGANNSITTGASSGALVLQGTTADPITSTNGITFASIDTAAGSTDAIVLENVEGSVTVNGGELITAANAAVQVDNATGLTLNNVELSSGGAFGVVASYDSNNSNALTLSGVQMNGDDLNVTTTTATAGANTTVNVSNVTGAGAVALSTTGAGDLTASLNTVTGTTNDAISMTVAGAGDGSLTMVGVNTGGTVAASSGGAATGNLTLGMINSGQTTQFGAITIDDQGDGNVSASLNNVDSNSTLDFDAAGDGSATLAVTGGAIAGAITADAANTGTFTANITGAGDHGSTLDINAGNLGEATINVTGNNTVDGATTIATTNSGEATVNLDGTFNDVVTVSADNTQDFNLTLSSSDINAGAAAVGFDVTVSSSVDNFGMVLLSNTYDAGISIDANNNGALDMNITQQAVVTGSNDVAFALTIGASVDNGDIVIADATYETNDANAFLFTNNATATVDFQLDDNAFESSSASQTAATITQNAGTLNATIGVTDAGFNGNSFVNGNNASDQFLMTSNNASTVNLLLSGNAANNGNGNFHLTVAGASTFNVHDLANTDAQNQGTVDFDPAIGNFNNLPGEPILPTP